MFFVILQIPGDVSFAVFTAIIILLQLYLYYNLHLFLAPYLYLIAPQNFQFPHNSLCFLFIFQCKRLLLLSTDFLPYLYCLTLYKKGTKFIKYYMTNSLNMKQINHFIWVNVIVYRFKNTCKSHSHPSEWIVSEKACYRQWARVEAICHNSENARAIGCTCSGPVKYSVSNLSCKEEWNR